LRTSCSATLFQPSQALPGGERSCLVVGAVARRPDQQPGVAGEIRIGMTGEGGKQGDGRRRIARVEESLALLEAHAGFIGHGRAL
jgi:hypothetical protein